MGAVVDCAVVVPVAVVVVALVVVVAVVELLADGEAGVGCATGGSVGVGAVGPVVKTFIKSGSHNVFEIVGYTYPALQIIG